MSRLVRPSSRMRLCQPAELLIVEVFFEAWARCRSTSSRCISTQQKREILTDGSPADDHSRETLEVRRALDDALAQLKSKAKFDELRQVEKTQARIDAAGAKQCSAEVLFVANAILRCAKDLTAEEVALRGELLRLRDELSTERIGAEERRVEIQDLQWELVTLRKELLLERRRREVLEAQRVASEAAGLEVRESFSPRSRFTGARNGVVAGAEGPYYSGAPSGGSALSRADSTLRFVLPQPQALPPPHAQGLAASLKSPLLNPRIAERDDGNAVMAFIRGLREHETTQASLAAVVSEPAALQTSAPRWAPTLTLGPRLRIAASEEAH